jgi:hypothetical protein
MGFIESTCTGLPRRVRVGSVRPGCQQELHRLRVAMEGGHVERGVLGVVARGRHVIWLCCHHVAAQVEIESKLESIILYCSFKRSVPGAFNWISSVQPAPPYHQRPELLQRGRLHQRKRGVLRHPRSALGGSGGWGDAGTGEQK